MDNVQKHNICSEFEDKDETIVSDFNQFHLKVHQTIR
jgi:hypothetical protein